MRRSWRRCSRVRNATAFQVDDTNLRSGLIYRVNEKTALGAKESSQMNFSRPDADDARKLNAILWQDAKGRRPCRLRAVAHSEPASEGSAF